MNSNKFMLNTKTEVLAVGSSSCLRLVDRDSAGIRGSNIPFKTYMLNTPELKLARLSQCRIKQHLLCLFSWIKTHCIHPAIYLKKHFCKTHHLFDYCNCLGWSTYGTDRSNAEGSEQSSTVCSEISSATPLLNELHWLPVKF